MIYCKTTDKRLSVWKGPKRTNTGGFRVWIELGEPGQGNPPRVSVYPEDARKFAMELLRMADSCD
jgi:hypothetical protein